MSPLDLSRLEGALAQLNALRAEEGLDEELLHRIEGLADHLFHASRHLVVYGSLAPGGDNHHVLDPTPGEWRKGWVTGELLELGWGAAAGYPALRWIPAAGGEEAQRVPAHLLVSEALPDHWSRLDRFEGAGYRRILVPFFTRDEGLTAVGNLYETARPGPHPSATSR